MLLSTTPRMVDTSARFFVGKKETMSLVHNATGALWKSFMPHRHLVENAVSSFLYAIQEYPPHYFDHFDAAQPFVKWAAQEVSEVNSIPNGMESIMVPAGLYAVWQYRGAASQGAAAFQYIFAQWLPGSSYLLDHRPHFEVLGEKYKGESPDSEEEIWIPVRLKI